MVSDDKSLSKHQPTQEDLDAAERIRQKLDEDINKVLNEGKEFTKIKTKVRKGKFAPVGSLFFGVEKIYEKTKYSMVVLVDCKGKDDESEALLYLNLYKLMVQKYPELTPKSLLNVT